MGIKYQLRATTLLPIFFIAFFFAIAFNWQFSKEIDEQLRNLGQAYIRQLLPASEYALLHNDRRTLQGLINSTIANPEIKSIAFYNINKHIVAARGDNLSLDEPLNLPKHHKQTIHHNHKQNDTLRFIAPVALPKENLYNTSLLLNQAHHPSTKATDILGWLAIDLDTKTNTIKQYRMLVITLFVCFIGLLLGLIINQMLSAHIYRPINRLRRSMRQILKNEFETTIKHVSRGEIGVIEAGCRHLQQAYLSEQDEFNANVEMATEDLQRNLEALEEKNIELYLQQKKVEEQSRQRQAFIANMSHEIRTPLNGILGFSNILNETSLSATQSEYVSTIKTSAKNLLAVVNDILDYSKIGSGQFALESIPFDIRVCIDEVISLLAPSAHKKSLRIQVIYSSELPLQFRGDPLRLKQIVTNLVGNAIKFTSMGEVLITVQFTMTSAAKPQLQLQVNDTGIGISEATQKQLFTPFAQGSRETSRHFGGTGLGLVICKNLAEKMHGTLTVESTEHVGSSFTLSLPLTPLGAENNDDGHLALKGKKICLITNDPLCLAALKENVKRWQISLCHYLSFEEYLAKAKTQTFSHYLIDVDCACHLESLRYIENNGSAAPSIYLLCQTHIEPAIEAGDYPLLHKPLAHKKLYDSLLKPSIAKTSTQQSATTYLKNMRILLAEDDKINQFLFNSILKDQQLDTVCNGLDAIAACAKQRYDIILLDLQMPKLGGIATSERLRNETSPNQHTPIIVISANIDNNTQKKLSAIGINGTLEKPFEEKTLLSMIGQLVQAESQLPAIDWQACLRLMKQREDHARELLAAFAAELPIERAALTSAYRSGDISALATAAHKLHGACCFCGVPILKEAVKTLETQLIESPQITYEDNYLAVIDAIDAVSLDYQQRFANDCKAS